MKRLGIEASYSRPRVSNDNAMSEALFRTTKYRPVSLMKVLKALITQGTGARCLYAGTIMITSTNALRLSPRRNGTAEMIFSYWQNLVKYIIMPGLLIHHVGVATLATGNEQIP